jgi:O-acetyl-ADP-ribose deacetylase (regulator of RNase III)
MLTSGDHGPALWERIDVQFGPVYQQEVEAIITSTHPAMRGAGGVDAAVHSKAGTGLMREIMQSCPDEMVVGAYVVTKGHDLPYKAIFHIASPTWQGGDFGEDELLEQCYLRVFEGAHSRDFKSVATCSISTGNHAFPIERAAIIALTSAKKFFESRPNSPLDKIVFALYHSFEYQSFCQERDRLIFS